MILEITTIIISLTILFLVYFARIKSINGGTFLFSKSFLNRADEILFDFVKFIFKLYSLLFNNISVFISKIPHKVVHNVNQVSHIIHKKSSVWIDTLTHKARK